MVIRQQTVETMHALSLQVTIPAFALFCELSVLSGCALAFHFTFYIYNFTLSIIPPYCFDFQIRHRYFYEYC